MNNEQKLLLDILSSNVQGVAVTIPTTCDINSLLLEASAQSVLSITYNSVNKLIPEDTRALWMERSQYALISNMRVSRLHSEIDELLGDIPYVILKGNASAYYYKKPLLRTMGDVDFLVNEDDVSRIAGILESNGFTAKEDTGGIHIGFHRDDEMFRDSVELHRSINGIPSGKSGELIKSYLVDIIETSVRVGSSNTAYNMPDKFHHGFVMLLHTASHLKSEGMGLRHLCDWAVYINTFDDSEWRAMFEDKLKACGLWRYAQILSLCCSKYLGCKNQPWMGEVEDEILEGLIEDILEAGNFGHKDKDRSRQIKYIANRGEGTVDNKSGIRQAIDTINIKANAQNKSRIGVVTDYVGMVIRGERKLDSAKTIEAAEKRKKLYSNFKLFDNS